MIDYSIFNYKCLLTTIKRRIYEQSHQFLFREMRFREMREMREMRDLDRTKSSKSIICSNIRRLIMEMIKNKDWNDFSKIFPADRLIAAHK